nr:hypothetical protein GCM10020092_037280 [Actinoplanes digitatis]
MEERFAKVAPLVVVGASAGGVEALRTMVGALAPDLPAAVLVVLHLPRTGPSALPRILDRAGPLRVTGAVDGQPLRAGQIITAPPDHHLLAIDGRARLSRGPTWNGHRPAVDPLFRSAARAAGPRTVAVVLSGSRDDGTASAAVVAEHGGTVIIQDPDDALHPSMPRSVLEHVGRAQACRTEKLGQLISETVSKLVDHGAAADELVRQEAVVDDLAAGRSAGFACPACHGGLFEMVERAHAALPVLGRAHLVAGEPARGAGGGVRGRAVDGTAQPRGEGRPRPAHGPGRPATAASGHRREVRGDGAGGDAGRAS